MSERTITHTKEDVTISFEKEEYEALVDAAREEGMDSVVDYIAVHMRSHLEYEGHLK